MALGQDGEEQVSMFITHDKLRSAGHVFYDALDRVLRENGFDRHVEELCRPFYAPVLGRPGLAPGVYFRCLLIGYFEGIDSERGIAWRVADSLSLRRFLRISLEARTPDHSTLSKTRKRLSGDVHAQVFTWVLKVLAEHGLLKGKTLGVDATTLEANAALRTIVRRDDGRGYAEYLDELVKADGVENPTREDRARLDRKRTKKGSNKDWVHPHDPDAQITKMKDGSTHLAHKAEHAVDLETGAVVSVTLNGGAEGDTKTIEKTLGEAASNLADVRENVDDEAKDAVVERIQEAVADKGYHSNDVLCDLEASEIRSYIPEPKRGRRNWEHKPDERDAVYRNRRRMARDKGKRLQRYRSERVERSFAHTLETGAMRRVHLRHSDNILKRYLIHVAGFNLGLLMRKCFGVGTPRSLQGAAALLAPVFVTIATLLRALGALLGRPRQRRGQVGVATDRSGGLLGALVGRMPGLFAFS